jgi:4-aminobutyrate aminotransferase-like enzyme/Ser/Thr protein kinase RdoA (MazF antagonist)
MLRHAPAYSAADAGAIARDLFGVEGEASPLPSERDQNFRVDTAHGETFVLKIANPLEERSALDAQNAALEHLSRFAWIPRLVPSRAGETIASHDAHFVRLVRWLPGRPLGLVKRRAPALFANLGRAIGALDRALLTFDHPAAHRAFHWDLLTAFDTIDQCRHVIPHGSLQRTLDALIPRLATELVDLPALPRSVVHNDPNDYNVLVNDDGLPARLPDGISGMLDFGDMIVSVTLADVAIAIAYAVLPERDPLTAAAHIVAGYHEAHPLDDRAMAMIFPLAQLRLCLSVAIAGRQQRERPDDEYLAISQRPIADALPRLAAIHPRFAEAKFRAACGLDQPRTARVMTWLRSQSAMPPVRARRTMVLDLSVASPLISGDAVENTEARLSARIERALREAEADVGIGRYAEPRMLYQGELFAGSANGERRTMHLGVDLFAPAETPVAAPLDGTVHALADNRTELDYGPVVILRHRAAGNDEFYTLYGHLSRVSLSTLTAGAHVRIGETFATLGGPHENGGWTPHLHFQLITDLLEKGTDYPGVCAAGDLDAWQLLTPDPSAILSLPGATFAARSKKETHLGRRSATGANLSIGYADPLQVARGWMQYLFDEHGRRFLDAYNNVPHVGHSHPRVAAALSDQLRVLNTNTRYLHDSLPEFARRLLATLQPPLAVCYFVNSGSEANELALRLARAHTKARDLIVLEHAYHGNTTTLVDISPYKFDGPGGQGRPDWVHPILLPDLYRGPFKRDDPTAARKYADAAAAGIAGIHAAGRGVCGFIAETCPSVAGQILLPPGYLEQVYSHVRGAGGVCIADEVQTAYGRMGTSFYAFEDHGVVPDILVLGKPIGNGYPLGAVVTTKAIADSFDNGMEFFSTFGGSTASCAAGLAVLDVVIREELRAHAQDVGAHLIARLRELAARHALVGDVRGSGLFVGVELVKDRHTLVPAGAEASYVVNRMRDDGVLIGTEGPFNNVLKIRPPMPFTVDDADVLVAVMDRVIGELE